MSSSSKYEDLKVKEIRDNDALIADYNDDYIYTVSVDTCDCDEFINTKNPCIHILYYNQFVIPDKDSIKLNNRIARLKYLAIIATLLIALAFFIAHVKNTNIKPYTNDTESLTALFTKDTSWLKCSDVSVLDTGAGDGVYTVFFTCQKIGDMENSEFLSGIFSRYINYCQEAYNIEGVNKVTFVVSTYFNDFYGNTNIQKFVKISMTRENFINYRWKTFSMKPILTKFIVDGTVELHNSVKDIPADEIVYYVFY